MANYKYYFQIDASGNPVPGSNVRAARQPRSNGLRRWKEFVPKFKECCDTPGEVETSENKRVRWFIRLDENNKPISGSLIKHSMKPNTMNWQEAVGHYCCTIAPSIDDVVINTFDPTWTGNILTLGNAADPQNSTVTLWTTGSIAQDDMTFDIDASQDGTVDIDQDDPTVNTTNTSVFTVTGTDGHGHHTTFTVTVNYENLPVTADDIEYDMENNATANINIKTLSNAADPEAQAITVVETGLVAGDNGDITLDVTDQATGAATLTYVSGGPTTTVFTVHLTDGVNTPTAVEITVEHD